MLSLLSQNPQFIRINKFLNGPRSSICSLPVCHTLLTSGCLIVLYVLTHGVCIFARWSRGVRQQVVHRHPSTCGLVLFGVSVGTTQLRLERLHQTEIAPGTKYQDTIAALGRALFMVNTLDFEPGMEAYIVTRTGAGHLREIPSIKDSLVVC